MSSPTLTISSRLQWLPRFRLRTLVVLFTLVACLTPVCWKVTQSRGEDAATRRYMRINASMKFGPSSMANATAVLPFVLRVTITHSNYGGYPFAARKLVESRHNEEFYSVWFFGILAKIPFTTTWDKPTAIDWEREFQRRRAGKIAPALQAKTP